jgi:capsular exopolysaccharide synthesis family protein
MRDRAADLQFDRLVRASTNEAVASLDPATAANDELAIAEQLVSLLAPGSYAADQYRSLRHSVERWRRESGLHLLAVTSSAPGDGKTSTTLNLAGALAQAPDSRVLVIDADLRRPSVARYLGLTRDCAPGLAEAILDPQRELSEIVRRLDRYNLSVLPSGAVQNAPYELLNSPRLEQLLREAKQHFDFVIVDTPPLVPLPDCRLIGKSIDGFLVIVGANKTPRRLLGEALTLLDPAKVIGVVFNGDDRALASHYGYYQYYTRDDRGRSAKWWRRIRTNR